MGRGRLTPTRRQQVTTSLLYQPSVCRNSAAIGGSLSNRIIFERLHALSCADIALRHYSAKLFSMVLLSLSHSLSFLSLSLFLLSVFFFFYLSFSFFFSTFFFSFTRFHSFSLSFFISSLLFSFSLTLFSIVFPFLITLFA